MSDTPSAAAPQLAMRVLESLVKVGALFGIVGYVSLRTRLQYLGVSCQFPLGSERYLMEVGSLIDTSLSLAFSKLGVACALGIAGCIGLHSLVARRASQRGRESLVWRPLQWLTSPGPTLAGLAVGAALLTSRLVQELPIDSSLVVGALDHDALRAAERCANEALTWHVIALTSSVAGWLVYFEYARGTLQKTAVRLFRVLFLVALLSLSLHVAKVFGAYVEGTKYYIVSVDTRGDRAQQVPGVLILEDSEYVRLWYACRGEGWILAIPQETVARINVSSTADILALARQAADDPDCCLPVVGSEALCWHDGLGKNGRRSAMEELGCEETRSTDP